MSNAKDNLDIINSFGLFTLVLAIIDLIADFALAGVKLFYANPYITLA